MRELTLYNEDNFREIERHEGVAVVRFSAPWCPPCQMSEDIFNHFAEQIESDVKVGKVNVDLAPVLTTKYEIWGTAFRTHVQGWAVGPAYTGC